MSSGLLPKGDRDSIIIVVPAQPASGVTAGTYTNSTVSVNQQGVVTSASSGAAPVLTLANEGGGGGNVFDAVVSQTANLRTIAGTSGLAAATVGTQVQVSLSDTAVAAGSYLATNVTVNSRGQLTTASNGGYGRTAFVDSVNGSDVSGAVNGHPFLTVSAALTAASLSTPSQVYVFPGTYSETIVMPAGVALRGISTKAVTIQQLLVTSATDLLTMADNCRVEDVTLNLSTNANVQIRGVVWPGTTAATAKLRTAVVTVTAGGASASPAYGLHSIGTASAGAFEVSVVRATTVSATGAAGATRGLLCDTAAHTFSARDCIIAATGGSTAIGAETNFAGVSLLLRTTSASGSTSDISQTLGTLNLGCVDLVNNTANGLGFGVAMASPFMTFGDPGALAASSTFFLYPGTENASATEVFVRMPIKCLCRGISVRNSVAATTRTDVFTVRKNGVNTAVTVSLPGATNSANSNSTSADFAAGDSLSVTAVTGAGGVSPQDTLVVVSLY